MDHKEKFRPDTRLRLMGQVRQVKRYHHYSYRTEKLYGDWIVRYIKFHGGKKHPKDMGKREIEAFLSDNFGRYHWQRSAGRGGITTSSVSKMLSRKG